MKFFIEARFVEGKDPAPQLAEELARVAELRSSGVIEQMFRLVDGSGGLVVAEAEDAEALKSAIATLPFAQSVTMSFRVEAIEVL